MENFGQLRPYNSFHFFFHGLRCMSLLQRPKERHPLATPLQRSTVHWQVLYTFAQNQVKEKPWLICLDFSLLSSKIMFGIWYHVPCVGTFIIKVDLCLKQLPVCISLLHTLFRFWAHVMSGYSIDRYKLPLPERCTALWVEKNVQLQEYFTGAHDTGFFGHLHALCLSGLSWTTALSVNWVAAQPKLSSVNSWHF